MDHHADEDDLSYWALAAFALLVLLVLALAGIVAIYALMNRQCYRLENGAVLGYEAIFDLSEPYFLPNAVPKLLDGTPIIRDETWDIHITDTAIYGTTMLDYGAGGFRFAWRADTGLVLRSENRILYAKIVAEAGPANWGFPIYNVGTGALMWELRQMPDHPVTRCPTELFTW